MSTLSVDTIQGKTTAGTVAMPSGTIVQARYSSSTTGVSGTTSAADVTLMTADAFTPKFANSKIIITMSLYFGAWNPNGGLQVVRSISGGATTYGIGDTGGTYGGANGFFLADDLVVTSYQYAMAHFGGTVEDTTHNTTSAITYSIRATSVGEVHFNQPKTNTGNGNGRSSITLMEVAQ